MNLHSCIIDVLNNTTSEEGYNKLQNVYHKTDMNANIPFSHKIPAVGLVGFFDFSWYFLRFTMIFLDPRNRNYVLEIWKLIKLIAGF